MASRETRRQRGTRRGKTLLARVVTELRDARVTLGVSQPTLARELGCSQPSQWRFEANKLADVGVIRLSETASILGLELSLGLYPAGDPIRDKGSQALGGRFDKMLSTLWTVTTETLLAHGPDQRSWDRLLRLAASADVSSKR